MSRRKKPGEFSTAAKLIWALIASIVLLIIGLSIYAIINQPPLVVLDAIGWSGK